MIEIKNKQLSNIIMFKLDKIENSFTTQELEQIKDLTVNSETISGEIIDISLIDLLNLTNLEELELINIYIGSENINILLKLSNLNKIVFDRCSFESTNFIKDLKIRKLGFINSNIEDYNFITDIKDLESLSIVNDKAVNLKLVENLLNLKALSLSYSNVINEALILQFTYLHLLDLDNTNIKELEFLLDFKELKKISVSQEQYNYNQKIMESLKERNVEIYNDNVMRF